MAVEVKLAEYPAIEKAIRLGEVEATDELRSYRESGEGIRAAGRETNRGAGKVTTLDPRLAPPCRRGFLRRIDTHAIA
jgi:hypothetical protein